MDMLYVEREVAVKWEVADTPKAVVIDDVLGFLMEQVYTTIIGERSLKNIWQKKKSKFV